MRFALVVLLSFSTQLHAAPAIERGSDDTIKLRGQGPNPWCFAFAEEQLLKDQACLPKGCPANANQWSASVFDIARVHAKAQEKSAAVLLDKDGAKLSVTKTFFMGSSESLPYVKQGIQSLRASKCTLEQPVFRMNRSTTLNPKRSGLYDQLSGMHAKLKSDGANSFFDNEQKKELKILGIQALLPHLEKLAKESADGDAFVAGVMGFTSCDDVVQIPQVEIESKAVSNEAAIRNELSQLLRAKKPVLLGVCSEVLEGEKGNCGGHAVVAKDIKGGKVLLVDSAFMSPAKKNADGSVWISLETVVKAVGKFGMHLEKSNKDHENGLQEIQANFNAEMARIKKELEDSMAAIAAQSGDFGAAVKETMANLRKLVVKVPAAKIKQTLIASLTEPAEGEEDSVDEIFIEEINNLDIRSLADVEKIEPLLIDSFKRQAEMSLKQMSEQGLGEGQFSWPTLELKHNMTWFK